MQILSVPSLFLKFSILYEPALVSDTVNFSDTLTRLHFPSCGTYSAWTWAGIGWKKFRASHCARCPSCAIFRCAEIHCVTSCRTTLTTRALFHTSTSRTAHSPPSPTTPSPPSNSSSRSRQVPAYSRGP